MTFVFLDWSKLPRMPLQVLVCLLAFSGNELFAQKLTPGTYTGFIEVPDSAGRFELSSSEGGRLTGRFRTTVGGRTRWKPWDASVALVPTEEAAYQIEFADEQRVGVIKTVLHRFDTPYGAAYVGSFGNSVNGRAWSGHVGIWLDGSLDPGVFTSRDVVIPKLKVNEGGRFRLWTAEPGGLANNATRSLLKDSRGDLWVGTVDGLNRFDGKNWTNFFSETAPTLPGWNFRGLAEDSEGNLVVLVKHHGLFRFKDGEWIPFRCNTELENRHISGLLTDRLGRIWTSIDTTHLGRIDLDENLTMWEMPDLFPLWRSEDSRGTSLSVAAFYLDGLVLGTSRGFRISGAGVGGFPYWIESRVGDLSGIASGFSGDLWVASLSVIHHYDEYGRVDLSVHPRRFTGSLRGIVPRRNGGIWVVGANGLFLMTSRQELIHFKALPTSVTEFVASLLEDDEGSLWIGTAGGGLCQFQPSFVESIPIEDIVSSQVSRLVRPVSIATDDEGLLLMALDEAVARDRGEGSYDLESNPGFDFTTVAAELGGRSSAWWSGVLPTPQYRVSAEHGREETPIPIAFRYADGKTEAYHLPSQPLGLENLSSMLWVEGSGAWLGTREGVWTCYDGTVENWNDDLGLPRFEVTSLLKSRDGFAWIGTAGAGLYRWNPSTAEVSHFSQESGELASNDIVTIAESEASGLWVSSLAGIHWNSLNESTAPFDARGDLVLPVHAVVEDRRRNLWVGTSTGVHALRSDEVRRIQNGEQTDINWIRFARADGLSTASVELGRTPMAAVGSSGEVYFCMQGDLITFDPVELLGSVSAGPRVRLTHLGDGERVLWRPDGSTPQSSSIRLPAGSGARLEVGFTATHFSDPDLLKFRYRIKSASDDWKELGGQQLVWLFDLGPGEYVFEVEAVDANLVKSPEPAVLSFEVMPHYYQTWSFQLGMVLVGLVLAGCWHHRRVRRRLHLEEMNSQLRLEADRRRIAHDMHDEIGASFAQLKILGELVESRRVEGRAQAKSVSRMVALARTGSQTLREILWALEPSNLDGEDLGEFLGNTIENLLEGSGIQVHYQHSWIEPVAELSPRFKREVILITKGIVSNVVRHSRAANFRCELHGKGPTVRLQYIDDGVGYDSSKLPEDTLGMQSLRQRVEKWGGVFEPDAKEGEGVKIEFSLDSRSGQVR